MSFRLKTILGIASIEIVLLAVLVLSGLSYLRQSSETELLSRGQTTAQLLSTMTADAVISVDLATLDTLVEQTVSNADVEYVRVRNTRGQVLSQAGRQDALDRDFVFDNSIDEAALDGILDVSAPILSAGEPFGSVELGLSTGRLQTTISKAQRWMLTIAGTEIVVVAIFGIGLGTILTRQLARLRSAAQRVASGEFGHQITVHGKDELADTTVSFNQMSAALAAYAAETKAATQRAEEGRDYAEATLNDAMNSMPQAVFIVDANGQLAFANKKFLSEQDEIDQATANNTPLSALFRPATCRSTGKAISPEQRQRWIEDVEGHPSWHSATEHGRTILTTQQRMSDGGAVVVDQDVTELYDALERNRQLEMELMQTQKLESLGTLAGGIAHEINTPVQYVGDNLKFIDDSMSSLSTILTQLSQHSDQSTQGLRAALDELDWDFVSEEMPLAINEARAGVSNVGDIVKSVKEFAHPDADEKSNQDLGKVISNTLTVSKNQWRHCADIDVDIGTDLEEVPCFAGKLSQVLINLVVNAADALREQECTDGKIKIAARRTGDTALIEVSDNGPGISQEIRSKIFDLFFTTKPPGQGTGQGLAICKRIIETNHGGKLSLDETPDGGALFRIELPMLQQADAA